MAEETGPKSQPDQPQDKPIPGPKQVGPEYLFEPIWDLPLVGHQLWGRYYLDLVRKPVHWIREKVIENKGPKYYWYHRRFKRALPIDECYYDDKACFMEANIEYRRNFLVDRHTVDLLQARYASCNAWSFGSKGRHGGHKEECEPYYQKYVEEEINFFIKYGEMKSGATVLDAYNKQKHRMIMERRVKEMQAKKKLNGEEEEEISIPYKVA